MWHQQLTKEQRIETLNQLALSTGYPSFAIEKDWWVCMVLRAVFQSKYKDQIIFKGGTSLSKAYQIIERFSEDVDLIIDRNLLGFSNDPDTKTQMKKLRKTAGKFVITDFREELVSQLNKLGITENDYEIRYSEVVDDLSDPNHLELVYKSVIPQESYVQQRVLIEMGARAMKEPSEKKEVQSFIQEYYKDASFSLPPFEVLVTVPTKTFLEKILLLHEEFSKPKDRIRSERMSRHLFDLFQLYHTEYGKSALEDDELFEKIIVFREKMNRSKWINYENHKKGFINIIPPDEVITEWENDYKIMQGSMIVGESPSFSVLIETMKEIMDKFNNP
ncbi:nucleotidyl transferase AbiEii/AbiGii toxin family protein [Chryseobacterium sp. TY4]